MFLVLSLVAGCGKSRPEPTLVLEESTNVAPPVEAGMTTFISKPGSKVRIEGTANMIHTHWQVESHLIGGFLEAGAGFPTEPGQAATPGKVIARAEPFVMVRALRSVTDDGRAYSDKMDEVMDEHLKATNNPAAKIVYDLTELTMKEPAKSKEAAYVFEAKGDLVVAGATNRITMPVNVLPLGEKKLKISGSTTVKMTDFKVEPPAPKILGVGALKTGDEVKLIFEWVVAPRAVPAAAAAGKN